MMMEHPYPFGYPFGYDWETKTLSYLTEEFRACLSPDPVSLSEHAIQQGAGISLPLHDGSDDFWSDVKDKTRHLRTILASLRAAIDDHEPRGYIRRMDAALDGAFPVLFTTRNGRPSRQPVEAARDLLRKQAPGPPHTSLPDPHIPGVERYALKNNGTHIVDGMIAPYRFSVSLARNQTVSRVALAVAISDPTSEDTAKGLHSLIDTLSILMDLNESDEVAAAISAEVGQEAKPSSSPTKLSRLLVGWYLSSTWYRVVTMQFYFVLKHHMDSGFDDTWLKYLAPRGSQYLRESRYIDVNWQSETVLNGFGSEESIDMPDCLCRWAFNLLLSERCSLVQDFRYLLEIYNLSLGAQEGRCKRDGSPCSGQHPLECGRFNDKALVCGDQTAHDTTCTGCFRVCWDESSFDNRSLEGMPKAIVADPRSKTARYTQASHMTMAISHVWSHGHGGRPHQGLNHCLHNRFSQIARDQGCESYWIDTLCIPEDNKRRKEAIRFINRIFASAKLVLVLDRDIMRQPDSPRPFDYPPDRHCSAGLLGTLLLSDWNVRAWTMLESVKGSSHLHILCKDNRVLAVRQLIEEQMKNGQMEFTILLHAAQHLVPSSRNSLQEKPRVYTVEHAGALLSHRHATRKGDDIVIWSLLMSNSDKDVFFSAEDLWSNVARKALTIKSAILMSNTPRLTQSPQRWAPSTPYARDPSIATPQRSFLVYDGSNSAEVTVTERGLQGHWNMLMIRGKGGLFSQGAAEISKEFKDFGYVALLFPLAANGGIYMGFSDRGVQEGCRAAVCVSQDKGVWEWKGVRPIGGITVADIERQWQREYLTLT